MHLGTQTGSLTNHLYSRIKLPSEVKVGDGATLLGWTDRLCRHRQGLIPNPLEAQAS